MVYLVKFDGGDQAYIGVKAFEAQPFREPRANQVVTTTFDPPLGETVRAYVFKRGAIFSADPDLIWERIKNDGPRSLREVPIELPPIPGRRASCTDAAPEVMLRANACC